MDWKKVVFSDEKKFNLRGPDSYFKYWGHGKAEKRLININKFNGGGIMVHLTTSYNGLISMVEMQEKFDSKIFCQLMDRDVLPLIPPYLPDQQFIFQQDNCPIHKSAYSIMFFLRRGIETLD